VLDRLKHLVEMVVASWRPDEHSTALPVGERRPQDLSPCFLSDRSVFIENQEVESVSTQGIIIVGAAYSDRATGDEFDPKIRFVRFRSPIRAGHFFERLPGDSFPLLVGRADVPGQAA